VVGRDAELRAVAQFVDRGRGATAVLVLQGEAGIGKTTVWAAALDVARERGFRVLVARPVEAEAGLAFTGLADIVADVLEDVGPALPRPQLKALRVALLLDDADGTPPDERAVGAALRSVLSEVARCGPTLLAIDDVQAAPVRAIDAQRAARGVVHLVDGDLRRADLERQLVDEFVLRLS